MKAISAVTRPHFAENCWCRPKECECCGAPEHKNAELAPDSIPRMAVFSDQRLSERDIHDGVVF